MKTIIVTGVGGDIGLPVARILSSAGHKVIGVDADDARHITAFGIEVRRIPLASDPALIASLTDIALGTGAQVIVPCIEPELPVWSSDVRKAFPAQVMAIVPELTALFSDKFLTAQWLGEHGLGVAASVPVERMEELDGPIIIKRRRGSGGRGMIRLDNAAQKDRILGLGSDYFAQKALDDSGGEITCGVFRTGGETRVIQIRRTLAGGITHQGDVVGDPAVETLCRAIAEISGLEGAINVQLCRTREGPKVFEINPRFSSTVMFRHMLGFEDVLWWLASLAGEVPPIYNPPIGARIRRTALEVVWEPGRCPRHLFSPI